MSSLFAEGTRLLPVSILSGPSGPALLQEISATHPTERIGLLTAVTPDSEVQRHQALPAFVIEPVSSVDEGRGHDPAQLIKQVQAIVDKGVVSHLIFQCDLATPAIAFASLFLPDGAGTQSLNGVAQLTGTVLALKSGDLLGSLVHCGESTAFISPCFLAEQIEFASHIVFEDAQDEPGGSLARAIAMTLNPRALISHLTQATAAHLLEAGVPFDFAEVLDGAGWRALIDGTGTSGHKELGVDAFAYTARKPFHPRRFWNLLQNTIPGVFRAKGFFWLATRMDAVGGLNLAGVESHCAMAGNWWASRDERIRKSEMPERTRKAWREPFGDRRQAIAFMGVDFDPASLRAELDACLLTDFEAAAGAGSWQSLTDPFPCWSHHDHGHDHGHDCDQHDCCEH